MRVVLLAMLIAPLTLVAPIARALPPAPAPAATATAAAASSSEAHYVDIRQYLTNADFSVWSNITARLIQNFDDVCGDTFCEGEYSNIESLNFRCSVENSTGIVGRCVWIFAASNEEVNASNGRILVDTQHWKCRSPLTPKTRIADLIRALDVPQPMRAILPGASQSIYDGLADCF